MGTSQYRPCPRTVGASASESATIPALPRRFGRTATSARFFAEDEFLLDAAVEAHATQRGFGRAAVRRVLRIGDGDAVNGRVARQSPDRASKTQAPRPQFCLQHRRRRSRRGLHRHVPDCAGTGRRPRGISRRVRRCGFGSRNYLTSRSRWRVRFERAVGEIAGRRPPGRTAGPRRRRSTIYAARSDVHRRQKAQGDQRQRQRRTAIIFARQW